MFLDDNIPDEIHNVEQIVRFIFSPVNVNKEGKLKPNAFKSPPNSDELSVSRLHYCDEEYCKSKALAIEKPGRQYFGLGLLLAEDVRNNNAEIVASPVFEQHPYPDNPAHADIKTGYKHDGSEYPAEAQLIADELAKVCQLFIDPNPLLLTWDGGVIKNN